jgi:uncharacterized RDD family membrane protein YckC
MSIFKLPAQSGLSGQESAARTRNPAPSLSRRMAAFTYEAVVLFGIVMVVGAVYSIAVDQRHGLQGRQGMMASQFLALSLYFLWFWTHGGQTLAAKTWHLRIVSADGSALSLKQALIRYMMSWLWLMPPWAIAWLLGWHQGKELFSAMGVWIIAYALLSYLLPQRQFLHDAWAATRVIDNRTNNERPAA